MNENMDLQRTRWACRRGMLELDMMFLPYFEHCYQGMAADKQEIFKELLKQDDTDLIEWFTEQSRAPITAWQRMIEAIKQHVSETD